MSWRTSRESPHQPEMNRPPNSRGRPPAEKETFINRYLEVAYDHPWSTSRLAVSYGGLYRAEVQSIREHCLSNYWIEPAKIVEVGRAAKRYAVTSRGAKTINWPGHDPAFLRDALFRLHHIDFARALISEWSALHGINWACSPLDIPASDIRSPLPPNVKLPTTFPDPVKKIRTVRLDAVGSMRMSADRHLHFSILIDPGDINISWFYGQFRSFQHWRLHPCWKSAPVDFPYFVLVAANHTRLEHLIYLWKMTPPWGQRPGKLFTTTRDHVIEQHANERAWWNENFQRVALWSGAYGTTNSTERPDRLSPSDENHRPTFTPRGPTPYEPCQRATRREQMPEVSSGLISTHQQLSPIHRKLLDLIARHPLIRRGDIINLGYDKSSLSRNLADMKKLWQETGDDRGLILSPRGIRLLSAQAGFEPAEYAKLRGWPVEKAVPEGRKRALLGLREKALAEKKKHWRMILNFMIGLARAKKYAPLRLEEWDAETAYVVRSRSSPVHDPSKKDNSHLIIVPDAIGKVSITLPDGQKAQTEFWLEIDRGSIRGRRLNRKIEKYFRARSTYAGMIGWLPKLLIVVEHDYERRARRLAGEIRKLNKRYGRTLDALIAREDQLTRPNGDLDPTLPRWRRANDWSQLVYAFDGLEAAKAKKERLATKPE